MKHKAISIFTLLALLFVILLYYEKWYYWHLALSILIVYVAITITGSMKIGLNYFVHSINRFNGPGIALTFDDGPDPVVTPKILEILQKQGVRASFFVVGKKAEEHPDIIKAIYRGGHLLGNHSYSHDNKIGIYSFRRLTRDLNKCSAVLENITGERTKYFRPPFGVTNPRFVKALKKLNLISVGWSWRSYDTVRSNPDKLAAKAQKAIKNGRILLLHDTEEVTAAALPRILEYCRKKAVKIVPLQDLAQATEHTKI